MLIVLVKGTSFLSGLDLVTQHLPNKISRRRSDVWQVKNGWNCQLVCKHTRYHSLADLHITLVYSVLRCFFKPNMITWSLSRMSKSILKNRSAVNDGKSNKMSEEIEADSLTVFDVYLIYRWGSSFSNWHSTDEDDCPKTDNFNHLFLGFIKQD